MPARFYGKIRNGSKASLFCHPYYLRYHHDPKNIGTKRCMTKEAVIFLFIAIVVEVIATISLKLSDSFTRLVPSLVTIIGYCIAFWCLTIPMRTIPAGIIYAISCGYHLCYLVWGRDCSYWIDRMVISRPKTGYAGYYWHVAYHLRRNRNQSVFKKCQSLGDDD